MGRKPSPQRGSRNPGVFSRPTSAGTPRNAPRTSSWCAADKVGGGLIVMSPASGIPEPDERLFFLRIRTARLLVNIFF